MHASWSVFFLVLASGLLSHGLPSPLEMDLKAVLLRMIKEEVAREDTSHEYSGMPTKPDERRLEVQRTVGSLLETVMKKREEKHRLQTRATQDGETCSNGLITTCASNQCDTQHSTCSVGCDNIGFTNPNTNAKEYYYCQCGMERTGPFCAIASEDVCEPGKPGGDQNECYMCFRAHYMKNGYACLGKDFKVKNTEDNMEEKDRRSISLDAVSNFIRAASNLLT